MDSSQVVLLLSLLVIIYYYNKSLKEPYSNQRPNETQFRHCNDKKGRPYYGIVSNVLQEPSQRQGIYTSMKRIPIDYDSYNSSPMCSQALKTDRVEPAYFNDNKVIDYKKNSWNNIIDPWDTYSSPTDNHSLIYEGDYHEKNFKDYHTKIRKPGIALRQKQVIH